MTDASSPHSTLLLDPTAPLPPVPADLLAAAIDFLSCYRPAPRLATETVIRRAVRLGYDAEVSASLCLRLIATSRLMAGPHWQTVRALLLRPSPEERVPFARAVQLFIATAPLDERDDFDGDDLIRTLLAMSAVHGHG